MSNLNHIPHRSNWFWQLDW